MQPMRLMYQASKNHCLGNRPQRGPPRHMIHKSHNLWYSDQPLCRYHRGSLWLEWVSDLDKLKPHAPFRHTRASGRWSYHTALDKKTLYAQGHYTTHMAPDNQRFCALFHDKTDSEVYMDRRLHYGQHGHKRCMILNSSLSSASHRRKRYRSLERAESRNAACYDHTLGNFHNEQFWLFF